MHFTVCTAERIYALYILYSRKNVAQTNNISCVQESKSLCLGGGGVEGGGGGDFSL
jgi:hypothetical protein